MWTRWCRRIVWAGLFVLLVLVPVRLARSPERLEAAPVASSTTPAVESHPPAAVILGLTVGGMATVLYFLRRRA